MSADWMNTTLQAVTSRIGDGLHGTPEYSDLGTIPFINGNNLNGSFIEVDSKTKMVGESEFLKHRKDLSDRTLLLSINGTLGKFAEYRGEKVVLGKSACYLNVKPEVDKAFIKYTLLSPQFQQSLTHNANGTTIKNASLKQIREFSFALPPLHEQQKISNCLEGLTLSIASLQAQNTTLEALAQTLFRSWFVNFDPVHAKAAGQAPEGMTPELAELFPSEFEESELGRIPKGWVQVQLSNLVIFNPTLKLPKNSEVSFTEMAALPTKGHQIDKPFKRSFSSGAKFQNGDTLFARITPCLENGKTGLVDYLEESEVGGGSTEFIVMRPADKTPHLLPYIIARNEDFRAHAEHFMTGTSGRQRVDWKDLARYPVTYSEKALQAFESVTGSFAAQLKINRQLSSTLSEIRDELLPRLISGKLRIDEAEETVSEALGPSAVEEKAA